MPHLYNVIEFPENSRMVGIWDRESAVRAEGWDDVALASLVVLGRDQDPDLEADALGCHLPTTLGGFTGRFPDGAPFVVLLQTFPLGTGDRDVMATIAAETMRLTLATVLEYNQEAALDQELLWSHDDLLDAYATQGVDADRVRGWSSADLLRGLLAETASASLAEIVAGFPGCLRPGLDHDCEGTVFRDAYAGWARPERTG